MNNYKPDSYKLDSAIMRTADRKVLHYIASAAYHLRQAEEYLADYKELENVSYYKGLREEWPAMAKLNRQLCQADLAAAREFICDLEDVGLISLDDWMTINKALVWFGVRAEDRYDD